MSVDRPPMAAPLWLIDAVWPGEEAFAIREIPAEEAQPWTDGVLFLFDRGKKGGERRTVIALAPGRWRSCARAPSL